jgi:hypothetical protein
VQEDFETAATETNNNNNEINTNNPNIIRNNNHNLFDEFIEFMTRVYVIVPTLYIIFFLSTPSYTDPFFYFLTNELKFTPYTLGQISFCSTIGILTAIAIYKFYLKNCHFRNIVLGGSVFAFIFSFTAYILVTRLNVDLGIPDFYLVLFSSSVMAMIGEIIMMPMLSLACLLCPKNLEGTVYSIFMSAINFGAGLASLNGSFITMSLGITATDYSNLPTLILISNFWNLFPFMLLLFLGNKYFEPDTKANAQPSVLVHVDSKEKNI